MRSWGWSSHDGIGAPTRGEETRVLCPPCKDTVRRLLPANWKLFPTSRTVRNVFVFLAIQFMIFHYSSPSWLRHLFKKKISVTKNIDLYPVSLKHNWLILASSQEELKIMWRWRETDKYEFKSRLFFSFGILYQNCFTSLSFS